MIQLLLIIAAALMTSGNPPPVAPVRPVTDDYFGTKIVDPYRYMENLDDPSVKAWITAQAQYTRNTLDKIPGRAALLSEITKYGNAAPAAVGDAYRGQGDRYFYMKTLPQENLAKLYLRQGLAGPETLLVDTDKFKGPHGEPAAINSYVPSHDGKYVAFVVSLAGHEIGSLHVLDTAAGTEIGQPIDRVWDGEVSWRPDNQSFFFTRLQKLAKNASPLETEENSITYLHVLGQSADADVPVFGAGVNQGIDLDPIDGPAVVASPDSDYALAEVARGSQNEIYLYAAPLASVGHPGAIWTKICDPDADVTDDELHGDDLYLLTHHDASRFKIIKTSISHPDLAGAQIIVPEGPGVVQSMIAAADALYVKELDGAISRVIRVPYNSPAQNVKLPLDGSVEICASEPDLPGFIFAEESWIRGKQIYQYDPSTDQVQNTGLRPAGPFDQPDYLVSEEVEVPSYDAAPVPLSIIHRKDSPLDGNRPTFIFAYGAYGITMDPQFGVRFLPWLKRGGVMAIAHVRGGGEKGEDWHLAGYKLTKPNSWRDLIACAQYLIDQKYTSPKRLGIWGGSAGGITIGRAITERPDLFAAAIPAVGVMNTVRAELSPNGPPNISEFGSAQTFEGFEDLYAMDSYLHVRDGVPYPAVMIETGLQDPRVIPWQPMKFAARLQAATSSDKPVLLRVDTANGHGIGESKKQHDEELADMMSFFLWQFGEPGFQPPTAP